MEGGGSWRVEKRSRVKTETQSGRGLQEKRDASRRQKHHPSKTPMSFLGQRAEHGSCSQGEGMRAPQRGWLWKGSCCPAIWGTMRAATLAEPKQSLTFGSMLDKGSLPAIRVTNLRGRLQLSPPKCPSNAFRKHTRYLLLQESDPSEDPALIILTSTITITHCSSAIAQLIPGLSVTSVQNFCVWSVGSKQK